MSSLPIKGINDIQSVADFSQAADKLGLAGADSQKLQTLVNSLGENGALAPGAMNEAAIAQTVEQMKAAGVLPPVLDEPQQVKNLAEAAKNLGVNESNSKELVPAVIEKAQALGIVGGGGRSDQGAIPINRLHFAPYEFKDIKKLEISQGVNQHARLRIHGTLHEAKSGHDYIQLTDDLTLVAAHYIDDSGTVKCLFKGIVTNINQRIEADVKYLEIESVSLSFLLDIQRLSRSFQRKSEPYNYIFTKVNDFARTYIKDLSGDVIKTESSESSKTTDQFILQYHETDWEFLKRLASHFNLGLVPDLISDMPQVHFGLPPKKEPEKITGAPLLNVSSYIMRRDGENFSKANANWRQNSGTKFKIDHFTYCEAASINIFGVGQPVTFLDKEFYIKEISTFLDGSVINSIYTLSASKEGLMQNDLSNPNITGISLSATVKKIENDTVQVHFDSTDKTWAKEEYDSGGTYMFPYTTIYSSPDGTGWYCMPELEDKVRVYFPSSREKDAVAASSINPISEGRGGRDDPDTKTISTKHGKKIIFTPKGIDIATKDNKLLIRLSDDDGLIIFSDKKITLEAEKAIEIIGKESIKIDSKKEISLTQSSAKIVVGSGGIELKASKVNLQ